MDRHSLDPTVALDLADLAGAIERWAADLALTEEPSCFLRILAEGAPAGEASR